jgi:YVTN family beta-propeller protein
VLLAAVLALVGAAAAVLVALHPWSGRARPAAQTVAVRSTPPPQPAPAPAAVATAVPIPSIIANAIPAGPSPTFVVASRDGRQLYVANGAAGTITVIDTSVNRITATIPVPAGPPQFLTFSPDGTRIYVSVWNDARTIAALAVVDATSNRVVTTVRMASRPFLPAVTADGSRIYVPNHDTGNVVVVDAATLKTVADIKVPPNPHWLSFTPDGRRIYVADHESNLLTVLDAATSQILGTIPVGKSPHSVAVNRTRPLVANVNYDANTVMLSDTGTNTVVATIPVGTKPQNVVWSPDSRFAYVVDDASNDVSVINATSPDPGQAAVSATVPVGNSPTAIAVLPDGRTAYVSNLTDGTLTELQVGR